MKDRTGPSTPDRGPGQAPPRPGRAWRKGRWTAFDGFAMARFVAAVRGGALKVGAGELFAD